MGRAFHCSYLRIKYCPRECAGAAESPVVVRPDANAARLADPIPVQANSFSDCCRTEFQCSQHVLRLQSTFNVLSYLLGLTPFYCTVFSVKSSWSIVLTVHPCIPMSLYASNNIPETSHSLTPACHNTDQ